MASTLSHPGRERQAKPRLLDISSPQETRKPEYPRLTSKKSGCFKDRDSFPYSMPRPSSRRALDTRSPDTPTIFSQPTGKSRPALASEPPLSRAIEQAALRELIDVPAKHPVSSFRRRLIRRKSSSRPLSRFDQTLAGREDSMTSPCQSDQPYMTDFTLTPELMILSDDSRILQYNTDGSPDRLPERILQLRPGTVAVASDALPGKHWVLSVVRDARGTERSASIKPSRPGLFSRRSEDKRQVQELLLAFSDPFSFDKWLITLRKRIESLGGLQYRPDSRGFDAEVEFMTSSSAEKHSPQFPSAPFIFPLARRKATDDKAHTIQISHSLCSDCSPVPSLYRDSATGSSYTSTKELGDTPVLEDIPSARSSYEEPAIVEDVMSIGSPKIDARHSMGYTDDGVDKTLRKKKSLPAPILLGVDARNRASSCDSAIPSPQFPRTPTLGTDTMHNLAGKFAPQTYTVLHSPVEATKMADWLSAVTEARQHSLDDDTTPSQEVQAPCYEDVRTEQSPVSESPISPIGPSEALPEMFLFAPVSPEASPPMKPVTPRIELQPPAYSLAPSRGSSLDATVRPSRCFSVSSKKGNNATTNANLIAPKDSTRLTTLPKHRKVLSVITTPTQSHLTLDTQHYPQRSPAVNDAHMATCFGVETPFTKQSISIGGESMDFPTTAKTLDFPASATLQEAIKMPCRTASMSRPKRTTGMMRQKSMPNIVFPGSISPPPTAPLPAVPDQSLCTPSLTHRRGKSTSPASSISVRKAFTSSQRTGPGPGLGVGMAPLGLNPVTDREKRFARRLSVALGLPVSTSSTVLVAGARTTHAGAGPNGTDRWC